MRVFQYGTGRYYSSLFAQKKEPVRVRPQPPEERMRSTNKAKKMKRRASQCRATHKTRLAALRFRTEARMAPDEAGKGKTKVGSKGSVKAAKTSKSEKR